MADQPDDYDSMKAADAAHQMWLRLARQIEGAIPDILIADDNPRRAVEWARYADACFFQAGGEADAPTVSELFKQDHQP